MTSVRLNNKLLTHKEAKNVATLLRVSTEVYEKFFATNTSSWK